MKCFICHQDIRCEGRLSYGGDRQGLPINTDFEGWLSYRCGSSNHEIVQLHAVSPDGDIYIYDVSAGHDHSSQWRWRKLQQKTRKKGTFVGGSQVMQF
jgi:hypothetical protein